MLGPLLFNIYHFNLFFCIGDLDMASYGDDNTPCICFSELDIALKKPKRCTIKIFEWYHNNDVKHSARKCNLIKSFTFPV